MKRVWTQTKKIYITLILTLGLVCSSYSQYELKWHNIVPLRGRDIAIDPYRDNVVWIAGTGGLKQYTISSNSWKSFTTAEGLTKIWCSSIFIEEDFVWVGTESGGANLFNLETERFTPFLQYPEHPQYFEDLLTVYAICPEEEGVWVGTDMGLFEVERFSLDTLSHFTMDDGLGENYVYSIADDGQYLWLATAYGGGYIPEYPPPTGGLSRLNKTTSDIDNFRIAEKPHVNWLNSLVQSGDILWIAGDYGLVEFDKRTELFSVIADDAVGACHDVVLDEDNIWCIGNSTDGREHLFQVDRKTRELKSNTILPYDWRKASLSVNATDVYVVKGKHFYKIPKYSLELEEIPTPFLPSPYCYAISGNNEAVYASSANTLVIIDQNDVSFLKVELFQDESDGIRGITLEGNDLWISTDRGLLRYDRSTLTLKGSYLPSLDVLFTVIDNAYVWASARPGLHRIDKRTGQTTQKDLSSELNTFGSPNVTSLVVDNDVIWLGFSGTEIEGGLISGLVKLDRYTLETMWIHKISIGGYSLAFQAIIDCGTYLLVSGEEISKVSKEDLVFEPFIDQLSDKMELKNSLLWVLIPDNGIKVFDSETGQELISLNESNGLLHNWVTDLYLSDQYAWFTTYAGISGLELAGISSLSSEDGNRSLPESFVLSQNYPNPFNSTTSIQYTLPGGGRRPEDRGQESFHTTLKIYNILGQEVRTVVDEANGIGHYLVTWDGRDSRGWDVPSGIYFYRLTAWGTFRNNRRTFTDTRRMLLVR